MTGGYVMSSLEEAFRKAQQDVHALSVPLIEIGRASCRERV